jgi:transposase
MAKVQRTYTQEFKWEAVRLARTSRKPITHVARRLGIHPPVAQGVDRTQPGCLSKPLTSNSEEEEVRQLKRELKRVE